MYFQVGIFNWLYNFHFQELAHYGTGTLDFGLSYVRMLKELIKALLSVLDAVISPSIKTLLDTDSGLSIFHQTKRVAEISHWGKQQHNMKL